MTDRYLEISQTPWGNALISMLGLPRPPRLSRDTGAWIERPLEGQDVVLGVAPGSTLAREVVKALADAGAQLRVRAELPGLPEIKAAAAALNVTLSGNPVTGETPQLPRVLVYDATGLSRPEELRGLYDFFQPLMARFPGNGRVVVLGRPIDEARSAPAAAASGALLGFVKSLAKEIGRKGSTANLVEVATGSDGTLAGALRFFLSDHSAFVSGQSLALSVAPRVAGPWAGALKGKVALVTGAARGIGAAIAETLAREGATVVGMDRPQEEGALGETLAKINGVGLPLDVTAPDTGARIVKEVGARFGGLDVVVHNAGITRDKTLRNMRPDQWDMVLDVNLGAIARINEQLLGGTGLKPGARMVCISSIGGIAGNAGQTNYGATKSGVIGYVRALAAEMAKRGGAVNAVAPGFIETQMTAMMPAGPRIVGRLMSSLLQGGLPADIAEAVTFLASPYAAGVNGRTLRVCGQHMVGA